VLGLLIAGLLLLPAGCPPQLFDDTSDIPQSGLTSPDPNSTAADDSSTPAVNGDSAVADDLTADFPGCAEPVQVDTWRAEILRLVNDERQSRGLDPVVWNQTLEDEATEYACEMIQYDFFAHVNRATGSTLTSRTADSGYDFWIVGENLAGGQRSPAEAMNDWMNSPCHRENILNPAFTELGVGVRSGGDYGLYWVQEFGRPFSTTPYAGPAHKDPECTHAE
jgi:uncharacterized protein YkwD